MSKEVEIEAKSMLGEIDYTNLYNLFIEVARDHYVQENYYIDTNDFKLIKAKAGARIRYKKDQYELTIKTSLKEGHLEINQNISKEEFLAFKNNNILPDGEVKNTIIDLGIKLNEIKIITSLTTDRLDIDWYDGILSIDKNTYSNTVDYEIEYENKSMEIAIKNLKLALDILKIPYHESKETKIKRAFSKL